MPSGIPIDVEKALTDLNVSRETLMRLQDYVEILKKWQKSINLVSKNTIDDVWVRHILDSAQLYPLISSTKGIVMDIGSGAGLPGIVLSIMQYGVMGHGAGSMVLVESDQRKCAFLNVAAQKCGVQVKVINDRFENLPYYQAGVIIARAVAPVENLLKLSQKQYHKALKFIFLKGRNIDKELTCLQDYSNIIINKKTSLTNPEGVILTLSCLDDFFDCQKTLKGRN